MALQKSVVAEGQYTNRLLLFDGSYYAYWNTRMFMKYGIKRKGRKKRSQREKKKNLALKISTLEEELEKLSSDIDEELTMMAIRFKKLMRQKGKRFGRKNYKKDQGFSWKNKHMGDLNKKDEMICFECKKPKHFISECPILKEESSKRMKKPKKAMVAVIS
ncbi:Uncharacterized protein TCM_009959 [Theobroma cacao]|uniref:CCHC-type domain-containing protein n=1 Tax=Theobroma cacao TaxID=3641 RepID=A0A061E6H4_THECC|nr:Uncharacterized protein TCM_009959 [Theobroma cacao]